MGDKKQKEALIKKAKQVLVIGACVLFVGLMILSGMGSHWLTMFTVVKPGDAVVVDYTMYDINGNPILTSSGQIYTAEAKKGRDLLVSKPLSIITGQNLTKSIYPVSIYTGSTTGWTKEYALFASEYDAIDQALVGMKTGDQKRVAIPNSTMTQEWTAQQLTRNGVNITELDVGYTLAMGVSDEPEAMATNNSLSYTRIGEITRKTNSSVIVDFGYPAVDISIVSINAKS